MLKRIFIFVVLILVILIPSGESLPSNPQTEQAFILGSSTFEPKASQLPIQTIVPSTTDGLNNKTPYSDPEATATPGTFPETCPPNKAHYDYPCEPPETDLSLPPNLLVHTFPSVDPESSAAISFNNDMVDIVDLAIDQSGISSIFGLYIMELKTNLFYGVNKNLTVIDETENVPEGYFNSASVIKLYQGYILCDMIRNNELDADKTYYDQTTGRTFKLLPMIKDMISKSDNDYSNASLRIVDNRKSNEVLNRLGISDSRLYGEMSGAIGYSRKNNIKKYGTSKRCARITPHDTALILYNIYINRDSDPYMKLLNEALIGNIYNSRIPVGVSNVSPRYSVAHKTGTNSNLGIYNDAGIIYSNNPFILVVLTQNTTNDISQTFIRSLAEQLTIYFDSRV